jgi:branched-chain amino acid transport system permease protein
VGLSLVFGTTGLINFAHGELVTFGAVVAWVLNVDVGMSIWIAAVLAIVAGALLSGALELGVFRRLQRRRIAGFQFLVISVGLALFIQNLLLLWIGTNFAQYLIPRQSGISLGPFTTTPRDAIIIALCIATLVGVALMLQRTRVGKAMRAISDNRELAESTGINVARVVFVVWVMGGALAALGGVFQGLGNAVQYQMGFRLLLLMFAAVILGGLGTAYGAMVGGLLVGLVSEMSTLWLPSELKSAWALAILIVVLLFRPQGVLGKRERFG